MHIHAEDDRDCDQRMRHHRYGEVIGDIVGDRLPRHRLSPQRDLRVRSFASCG